MKLSALAKSLYAFERTDSSDFQRRARILQSMWRQERGFACGEHRSSTVSRPLGSRLPMPWAEESLANFLTEGIREVVRSEVCRSQSTTAKLYGRPRIFNDLLSSQPLCFNLFAELKCDLALASSVVSDLTQGRFARVISIEFEFSPGRGDSRYLADRSAFDVFLKCINAAGTRGFIGIEVKYHENLSSKPARHRSRYDEVADLMGCFVPGDRAMLRRSPLQQLWRDHLLAGITRSEDGYEDGLFVVLYPKDNEHVHHAICDYRERLTNTESFGYWTLEDFCHRVQEQSSAAWIALFIDRYLAFAKIGALINESSES